MLVGLGIRHVGPTVARGRARGGTLAALRAAPLERLASLDGVGPVIADSVVEFLANPANQVVIDRLERAGVRTTDDHGASGAAPALEVAQTLTAKSVVVTGTVEGYTREEAEAAILSRGGTSPSSVSKKTFAVVVGANPGAAKVTNAETLGVPMIDATRFDELLTTGLLPSDRRSSGLGNDAPSRSFSVEITEKGPGTK